MQPNLLLIMVDSLRPDFLGQTKNSRKVTPCIDSLAQAGVFMENAFCPMPSSAPSRATIFTGRFPHSHGVKVNDLPLPARETTLAQILDEAGYTTAAAPKLDEGFEKGFQHTDIFDAYRNNREAGHHQEESTLITDAAIEWIQGGGEPWFLWLDYESIHEPWRPPERFRSLFDESYQGDDLDSPKMYQPGLSHKDLLHIRSLYRAEVAMMDENIGRLLKTLERADLRKSTIVILLSDHGVFLGEHQFFKKPPFLYDPLIKSTLIFSWPGELASGLRVDSLAQMVDVLPTILSILDLPAPEECQGRILGPILDDGCETNHEIFVEFCEYKGTAVKAVRNRRWKLIHHRSVGDIPWAGDYSPGEVFEKAGLERDMLFDLSRDPHEEINVLSENPHIGEKMRTSLLDWMIDNEG